PLTGAQRDEQVQRGRPPSRCEAITQRGIGNRNMGRGGARHHEGPGAQLSTEDRPGESPDGLRPRPRPRTFWTGSTLCRRPDVLASAGKALSFPFRRPSTWSASQLVREKQDRPWVGWL